MAIADWSGNGRMAGSIGQAPRAPSNGAGLLASWAPHTAAAMGMTQTGSNPWGVLPQPGMASPDIQQPMPWSMDPQVQQLLTVLAQRQQGYLGGGGGAQGFQPQGIQQNFLTQQALGQRQLGQIAPMPETQTGQQHYGNNHPFGQIYPNPTAQAYPVIPPTNYAPMHPAPSPMPMAQAGTRPPMMPSRGLGMGWAPR